MYNWLRSTEVGIVLIILLILFPLVTSALGNIPFVVNILIEIFIFAVFAMSFNLLVGYTGYVSFGHALFLGAGAYATALLVTKVGLPFALAVVLAVLIAGLAAVVVGIIAFRRSGVYFAIITLGVAQVVYIIFRQWDYVGGTTGVIIDPPTVLGYQFSAFHPVGYYYIFLMAMLLTYLFTRYVVQSRFGHVLQAIRENEERAEAIGYNIRRFKIGVFLLSGALAGFSGALYAAYFTQVTPGSTLYWTVTGTGLFMILIGGLGTLVGPIIGATFVIGLQYLLSTYLSGWIPATAPVFIKRLPERWQLLLGVIFVVTVLYFRNGIAGGLGFSQTRSTDHALTTHTAKNTSHQTRESETNNRRENE